VQRRYDRLQNPTAYLRTCVVNGCRSWQRRQVIERRHAQYQNFEPSVDLGAKELDDALRRLPMRQRAALVLRFYGGLTENDIAASLGCRPGSVGPLIHRGLAALREVIER
jgi:RNA polymerase sigma factor (sigma-70 family)